MRHATALPADAIDASQKSDNAGGGSDPGTDETLTIDLNASPAQTIPTDGRAYNLIGDAASINATPFAGINNASKITLRDDLGDLLKPDGTISDAAKNVLAIDKVTAVNVTDTLANLAVATLPAELTAKPLTYVIDAASVKNVTIASATVAQATGAKDQVNAFLADTSITKKMSDNSVVPTEYTGNVTINEIADTAANIAAATSTVLTAATTVTVEDSVAGVQAGLKVLDDTNVDNVDIVDSLANIADMPTAIFDKLTATSGSLTSSFTATDTADVTLTYNAAFVNAGTPKLTINFDSLSKDSIVTLDASKDSSGIANALDLNKLFSFDPSVEGATVDFKGSTSKDVITAHANGGVLDGNGGADEFTLGAGKDTVVLGNGWELPTEKTATPDETNNVTVNGAFSEGDTIQLAGVLAGFTSGEVKSVSISMDSNFSITAGKLFICTDTDGTKTDFDDNLFKGLTKAGDSAIVAIASATSTTVYYLEELDGTDGIKKDTDIIVKLATISNEVLDLADFGITAA